MEYSIDICRMLSTLSLCLDFTSKGIQRHHQRVAHIGLSLGKEIGLTEEENNLIFMASIIHDAGVSTWQEKNKLLNFEVEKPWDHCYKGYEKISKVDILHPVAKIIFTHHDRFDGNNKSGLSGKDVPLISRIVHLADRIEVLLSHETHILKQNNNVTNAIEKNSGQVFDPELVAAFKSLANRESFWLELTSPFLKHAQTNVCTNPMVNIKENDMRQLAKMFASVIDDKSPFTHKHSQGVASVAMYLATIMGFKNEDVYLIELAGLMHDIGKLSVPDEILEKPGQLTTEEFAIIKQHSFYSYQILKEAGAPSPIPEWSAYHHEKLDGSGYPFHLNASHLQLGSRILAVADVFTALREERPYRPGMSRKNIEGIMNKMVSGTALDKRLVSVLFDNYNEFDEIFMSLSAKQDY
ncbi:MAG: Cyclic di-GMP phosphodiesterase response regulator RpfG [Pelotomaculum sp. PtaU1.Bin035]|nr:MAG: Cyclic di-GMP phosphodiesterase response regulator RpfG [Pelotomaculum sp. PtaU1.Bin035]